MIAEAHLGIPVMVQIHDILVSIPNRTKIIVFVSQLHDNFSNSSGKNDIETFFDTIVWRLWWDNPDPDNQTTFHCVNI